MRTDTNTRPAYMRFIRRFAWPIIIGWLLLTIGLNVLVPQIESVARNHAVTMSPQDAPALIAAKKIGRTFQESTSDSLAMVVLTGDDKLGDAARQYYGSLIGKFRASEHVQHVQDFWGDPLTAAGAQSVDGKATYVQVYLSGNQGEALANESVKAVQDVVASAAPPPAPGSEVRPPAPLDDAALAGRQRFLWSQEQKGSRVQSCRSVRSVCQQGQSKVPGASAGLAVAGQASQHSPHLLQK